MPNDTFVEAPQEPQENLIFKIKQNELNTCFHKRTVLSAASLVWCLTEVIDLAIKWPEHIDKIDHLQVEHIFDELYFRIRSKSATFLDLIQWLVAYAKLSQLSPLMVSKIPSFVVVRLIESFFDPSHGIPQENMLIGIRAIAKIVRKQQISSFLIKKPFVAKLTESLSIAKTNANDSYYIFLFLTQLSMLNSSEDVRRFFSKNQFIIFSCFNKICDTKSHLSVNKLIYTLLTLDQLMELFPESARKFKTDSIRNLINKFHGTKDELDIKQLVMIFALISKLSKIITGLLDNLSNDFLQDMLITLRAAPEQFAPEYIRLVDLATMLLAKPALIEYVTENFVGSLANNAQVVPIKSASTYVNNFVAIAQLALLNPNLINLVPETHISDCFLNAYEQREKLPPKRIAILLWAACILNFVKKNRANKEYIINLINLCLEKDVHGDSALVAHKLLLAISYFSIRQEETSDIGKIKKYKQDLSLIPHKESAFETEVIESFTPRVLTNCRVQTMEPEKFLFFKPVDILFTFKGKRKGLIIEIDGPHHDELSQQMCDQLYTAIYQRIGYIVVRISYKEFTNLCRQAGWQNQILEAAAQKCPDNISSISPPSVQKENTEVSVNLSTTPLNWAARVKPELLVTVTEMPGLSDTTNKMTPNDRMRVNLANSPTSFIEEIKKENRSSVNDEDTVKKLKIMLEHNFDTFHQAISFMQTIKTLENNVYLKDTLFLLILDFISKLRILITKDPDVYYPEPLQKFFHFLSRHLNTQTSQVLLEQHPDFSCILSYFTERMLEISTNKAMRFFANMLSSICKFEKINPQLTAAISDTLLFRILSKINKMTKVHPSILASILHGAANLVTLIPERANETFNLTTLNIFEKFFKQMHMASTSELTKVLWARTMLTTRGLSVLPVPEVEKLLHRLMKRNINGKDVCYIQQILVFLNISLASVHECKLQKSMDEYLADKNNKPSLNTQQKEAALSIFHHQELLAHQSATAVTRQFFLFTTVDVLISFEGIQKKLIIQFGPPNHFSDITLQRQGHVVHRMSLQEWENVVEKAEYIKILLRKGLVACWRAEEAENKGKLYSHKSM